MRNLIIVSARRTESVYKTASRIRRRTTITTKLQVRYAV